MNLLCRAAVLLTALGVWLSAKADDLKLSGELISTTDYFYGYAPENVCDGDLYSDFYAYRGGGGYVRSWIGYDLGEPHVITKIGFAPGHTSGNCSRLAIFQGANCADFSDAMPIAAVPPKGMRPGQMNEIEVTVSRGFRYVRMVGAGGVSMLVAELEFYGHPGEGDDSQFFQLTNLPTVAFNTPGMAEITSADDKHPGSMIFVISDDGHTLLADTCEMKGRGNGSWTMEKKPFRIKFNKKKRILDDAPAKAKKWTLINNHGDKTLMRNKVGFDISRSAGMAYTPYCRFVDVIYNGEYAGCYQLCDQIDVRKGRVDITEMTDADNEGEALTGGYLIEVDAYADQEVSSFTSPGGIPVTIKSPDDDKITRQQRLYIESFFNRLDRAVFGSDFDDPELGFRQYLDVESFLRYFICSELFGNPDAYWSTFLYKDRGADKLSTGPIWDLDLAFNNDVRVWDINRKPNFLFYYGSVAGNMRWFVDRVVIQDPESRRRLSEIWSELRLDPDFSAQHFCELIDEYAAELSTAQDYNFRRWDILDRVVHQNPFPLYTYDDEVAYIKEYLTDRFDLLDDMIGLVELPETDGIDSPEIDAPAIYYRLDGTLCSGTPTAPGIYIKRQGSTTRKVAIRL